MANVPVYQESIPVQDPGVPQARLEPITPAAAPTAIGEAIASSGKQTEELGSKLLTRQIMLDRIEAQQQGYVAAAQYHQKAQALAQPLLQKRGMDAKGISEQLDAMLRGSPAAPGKAAVPSPMDEFQNNLGARAKTAFIRQSYSYNSALIGRVKNHEDTEVNKGMEENATTAMNDQIGIGSAIRNPEDLKKAQDQLGKIFDADDYWHTRGYPPNKLASMRQGFLDHQAEAAVKENISVGWQKGKSLLDVSNVSPAMKAHLTDTVNGARTEQTADGLSEAIVNDKTGRFRTPTGEFDESKIQPFVDTAIKNAKATGLPAGHDNTIAEKVRSSISMRNTEMEQQKRTAIETTGDGIWRAFQKGVPSDQAYDQFIKQGQFANSIERGKAEDLFKKVYEHDPTALDSLAEHWSPERQQAYKTAMDSKDVNQKFPMSEDKKAFGDSLRQQIVEKNIHSRDGINQLLQDNLKTVPSGDIRWPINPIGWVAGREHTAQYADMAEAVQKNQSLIKAVGGTAQAVALAQNIGGVDKLAPDTDEAKAVMALIQRGAKPEQIRSNSIDAVVKKHPDWLK